VEVCLFSENTKEWINCYKDGDVSSSVVFNSGLSWVESLSYDRNEWVELHKQMGATKAQIILRDVDFQWLLRDVLISKMSMPLVRSCVWLCAEGRGSFQDGGDLLRLHQQGQHGPVACLRGVIYGIHRSPKIQKQVWKFENQSPHSWKEWVHSYTDLSRDPKDQSKRYIPIDCWKTQKTA